MALSEWVMVVDVDLDPECESDWNEWYDNVHLQEIIACPGFVRATRYIAPEADENDRRRHLTIYELTDAQALASDEFEAVRGLGPFPDRATARTRLYRRHLVYEPEADA